MLRVAIESKVNLQLYDYKHITDRCWIFHKSAFKDFYGDLVYKLKKIVGSHNFSAQFIKIISPL